MASEQSDLDELRDAFLQAHSNRPSLDTGNPTASEPPDLDELRDSFLRAHSPSEDEIDLDKLRDEFIQSRRAPQSQTAQYDPALHMPFRHPTYGAPPAFDEDPPKRPSYILRAFAQSANNFRIAHKTTQRVRLARELNDLLANPEKSPEYDRRLKETQREYDRTQSEFQELRQKIESSPPSPEVQALIRSNQGVVADIVDHANVRLVAELGALSSVQSALIAGGGMIGGAVGAATLRRPLVGAAAATAATSFVVERNTSVLHELLDAGVDVGDNEALLKAVQNEELMDEVVGKANKRAASIGMWDAGSLGVAKLFQLIKPNRRAPLIKRVARSIVKGSASVTAQGVTGAAGEAQAQYVTEGHIKSGEVAAEFLGELVTGPIEIVTAEQISKQDALASFGNAVFDEQQARYVPETGSRADKAKADKQNAELIENYIQESLAKLLKAQEKSQADQRQQAAEDTEGDALDKTIAGEQAAADTERATDVDGNPINSPPANEPPSGGASTPTAESPPPEDESEALTPQQVFNRAVEEREQTRDTNDQVVHSLLQHGTRETEDTRDIHNIKAGPDKIIHLSDERIPWFSDRFGTQGIRHIFKSTINIADMPEILDLGLWNPLDILEYLVSANHLNDTDRQTYLEAIRNIVGKYPGVSFQHMANTDHTKIVSSMTFAAMDAGVSLSEATRRIKDPADFARAALPDAEEQLDLNNLTRNERRFFASLRLGLAYGEIQAYMQSFLINKGIHAFRYANMADNEQSPIRGGMSVGILNKNILVALATVTNGHPAGSGLRNDGSLVQVFPNERYTVEVLDASEVSSVRAGKQTGPRDDPTKTNLENIANRSGMRISPFKVIVVTDRQTGIQETIFASIKDNNAMSVTGITKEGTIDPKSDSTVNITMVNGDGQVQGGLTAKVQDKSLRITESSPFAQQLTGTDSSVEAYNTLLDLAEKEGLVLESDSTVSAEAYRMYEALIQKGVSVQFNKKAKAHTGPNGVYYTTGDVNTPVLRVSNIQGRRLSASDVQALGASQIDPKLFNHRKLVGHRLENAGQALLKSGAVKGFHIVNSQNELPEHLQPKQHGANVQARAVVDPKTSQVYFVLDNIEDVARAEQVVLHELVGHIGLRATFGVQLDPLLDSIWNQQKAKIRELAKTYKGYSDFATNTNSRRRLTEEWIAHQAETMTAKQGIGKQIIQVLQRILASIGLGKWREGEVLGLLQRLKKDLETPGQHMSAQSLAKLEKNSAMASLFEYGQAGRTAYFKSDGAGVTDVVGIKGTISGIQAFEPRAAIKAKLEHSELEAPTFIEFEPGEAIADEYYTAQSRDNLEEQTMPTSESNRVFAQRDVLVSEKSRIFLASDTSSGMVMQGDAVVAFFSNGTNIIGANDQFINDPAVPAMQALAEGEGAQTWGPGHFDNQQITKLRNSHNLSVSNFLDLVVPAGGLRAPSLAVQSEQDVNDFDGDMSTQLTITLRPEAVRYQGQTAIKNDDWYSPEHPPIGRESMFDGRTIMSEFDSTALWDETVISHLAQYNADGLNLREVLPRYRTRIPPISNFQIRYGVFRKQFLKKAKQQIQEQWGDAIPEIGRHVLSQYTRNLTEREQNDLIDEALDYTLKDRFFDVYMTLLERERQPNLIVPGNWDFDRITDSFISTLFVVADQEIADKKWYTESGEKNTINAKNKRQFLAYTAWHKDKFEKAAKEGETGEVAADQYNLFRHIADMPLRLPLDPNSDRPVSTSETRKLLTYFQSAANRYVRSNFHKTVILPTWHTPNEDRPHTDATNENIFLTMARDNRLDTSDTSVQDERERDSALQEGRYADVMRPANPFRNNDDRTVVPVLSKLQAREEVLKRAPRFHQGSRSRLLEAKPFDTVGFDMFLRISGSSSAIHQIRHNARAMRVIEEHGIELYELTSERLENRDARRDAQNHPDALYSLQDEINKAPDISSSAPAAKMLRWVGVGSVAASSKAEAISDLKERIQDKLKSGGRLTALKLYGRRFFQETLSKDIAPNMHEYFRLTDVYAKRRNYLVGKRSELAIRWRSFASKNPEMNAALGSLMHTATILGQDPARDFVPSVGDVNVETGQSTDIGKERQAAHETLVNAFRLLSPEAQEIYRDVRDAYAEGRNALEAALIARIEKVGESESAAAIVDRLRKQFESGRIQGPYFPLSRYGKFWAAVKVNGEITMYGRFETEPERKKWLRQIEEVPDMEIQVGQKLEDQYSHARTVDPDFVAKVENVVKDQTMRKEIWELYIDTLPEASIRKHFMRRKNRLGFSVDALRNYANFAIHASAQQARLEHGHERNAALAGFREDVNAINNSPDKNIRKHDRWASDLFDELRQRHELETLENPSIVSELATSFGFAWFLGGSGAAAALNLFQLINVTFPRLVADHSVSDAFFGLYNAISTAAVQGKKPGKAWIDNIIDSLAEKEPELSQALRTHVDDGLFGNTQAMELAGLASASSTATTNTARHASNGWGALFHGSEFFVRVTTFIAAHRLADKKKKQAKQQMSEPSDEYAAYITFRTHLDYKSENRPQWMQHNVLRVAALFSFYSIQMGALAAQTVKQATAGSSPEEKRMARRFLAGSTMMYELTAGATGLPSAVMVPVKMLLSALLSEDDEPWDFETEAYAWLNDVWGETTAKFVMEGAVDTFTPASVSDRVGLHNLVFRSPYALHSDEQKWQQWMSGLLGPVPSAGLSIGIRAPKAFQEGEFMRGLEHVLPKAVADGVKAARYAMEGVTSRHSVGLEIVPRDDLHWGDIAAQAIGFTPSKVMFQRKENLQRQARMKWLRDKKTEYVNMMSRGIDTGDTDLFVEGRAKLIALQNANRSYDLSIYNVESTIERRLADRYKAVDGVIIPDKMRALERDIELHDVN